MDEEAFIRWLLGMGGGGQGYLPSVDPQLFGGGMYSSVPSELDKDGDPVPYDIDVARDQLNYLQDIIQTASDPSFLTSFGGAYAGYRPEDFEPTYEDTPVERPGAEMMNYRLSQSGSLEGWIAQQLNQGYSATEVYNTIQAAIADPEAGPESAAVAALVPLAPRFDDPYADPAPDLNRVWNIATEMEQAVLGDPSGNYVDPETGQHFNREVVPSEAQAEFDKQGLPNPYEEYSYRDFLDPKYRQAEEERSASAEQMLMDGYDNIAMTQNVIPQQPSPITPVEPVVSHRGNAPGTPFEGDGIKGGVSQSFLEKSIEQQRSRPGRVASERRGQDPEAQMRELEQAAMRRRVGAPSQDEAISRTYSRQYAQAMRGAGRTPYTDQRQSRQMLIQALLGPRR